MVLWWTQVSSLEICKKGNFILKSMYVLFCIFVWSQGSKILLPFASKLQQGLKVKVVSLSEEQGGKALSYFFQTAWNMKQVVSTYRLSYVIVWKMCLRTYLQNYTDFTKVNCLVIIGSGKCILFPDMAADLCYLEYYSWNLIKSRCSL